MSARTQSSAKRTTIDCDDARAYGQADGARAESGRCDVFDDIAATGAAEEARQKKVAPTQSQHADRGGNAHVEGSAAGIAQLGTYDGAEHTLVGHIVGR